MNTIKTLALATIIIGMASCASTQNLKCYECVDNNKKKVEVVVYEPLPGQGDARILSIGGKEYTE